jgi:hypothetical protein
MYFLFSPFYILNFLTFSEPSCRSVFAILSKFLLGAAVQMAFQDFSGNMCAPPRRVCCYHAALNQQLFQAHMRI